MTAEPQDEGGGEAPEGSEARPAGDVRGRPVKSAERALSILEVLGDAVEPMSVVELQRRCGYPRSSLHQLLHTMAGRRWLELSRGGTHVAVGSRALIVGTSYLDRDQALQQAHASLETVRDRTGWTTHYARLEGAGVDYLATREAAESHRRSSRIGRQLPAHATSLGKALLAELSTAEVAALLPDPLPALTPHTVTDLATLEEQLAQVRLHGCAVEREENTTGVSCVAAVVPYRIPATDAISCSLPLVEATEQEVARVSTVLQEETRALATRLRRQGVH